MNSKTNKPGRSLTDSVADYAALTKPGILVLLVITAVCAMFVARRGLPPLDLIAWTSVGTILICGSANACNMVWDRDIDAIMSRTSDRPLVTGAIRPASALVFALSIGLAGLSVLYFLATPMAALMGLCGHLFYVFIYTMWLKRRTPQNIVIGGAAGAFPPLIGWAAVTGGLSLTAWLLFAVIFLWTPPHFWALALYKDTEYQDAGVPMMPVVYGRAATKEQMISYTLILIGATALVALVGMLGIFYLTTAVVLGAVFTYCCVKTAMDSGTTWAKRTFAFSIVYLGLLFGAMSIDAATQTRSSERPKSLTANGQSSSVSGREWPAFRLEAVQKPPPP